MTRGDYTKKFLSDHPEYAAYLDDKSEPEWKRNARKSDIDALHGYAVKDAVAAGKSVPSEVLKDYPDLAKSVQPPFPAGQAPAASIDQGGSKSQAHSQVRPQRRRTATRADDGPHGQGAGRRQASPARRRARFRRPSTTSRAASCASSRFTPCPTARPRPPWTRSPPRRRADGMFETPRTAA